MLEVGNLQVFQMLRSKFKEPLLKFLERSGSLLCCFSLTHAASIERAGIDALSTIERLPCPLPSESSPL